MNTKINLTDLEKERIFSKISIDPKTECWNWTAAKNRGYGAFNFRGNTVKIHRLLFEVFVRLLPKYNGIDVLDHVVCNNPGCCNPSHVKLVKQSFNVLRSNSVSGIHSRKTHCNHGHLLPKPNELLPGGNLGRRCHICRKINKNLRYLNQKAGLSKRTKEFR